VANYEGHGFGRATLRTATALSINTVYAGLRLGGGDADRGARAVVEAARRMGVGSPLPAVPSSVLGTGEVTPPEMASAYATLAAKGRRAAPFGVRQITGPDGRVLYQARPDSEQVVPPEVAAIAADVLCEVVDHGTGARGRIGRPAAAKTGTTQDHADAWFVGFTPSLAAAVWVGYPQGQVPMAPPRTTNRVSGGTWPAAIWGGFTPAAQVASIVYLRASAPTRTCREPAGPVQGVVPALVGVPAARAAAWLSGAGLSLRQRLRVDDAAAPGTVLAQSPAGGAARPPGAPVELTVAVDASGAGGLGVTLVPEVLGQPEATARQLLAQAGLAAEVLAGCDADPARAAAEPSRVWRSGPAPGAQSPPPARCGCGSTRPTAHFPPQPADRCRRGPTGTPVAHPGHGTGCSWGCGGARSPHMDQGLQQLKRPLSSAGPCPVPNVPAGRRSG
jgi:membrane peptidoglycan carboxypeptidase